MNVYNNLSDDDLVELLRQDELSAFKEIYKRYWKKLYGSAFQRLKSNELSEEVVQELFTNLWIKRSEIEITSLPDYLFSSVRYLTIDCYRKEIVRSKYRESMLVMPSIELDNSTEDEILLHDLNYQIETEISHLPDKCRSVYELSRKEYKSNKEIALHLGISEKTVENHISKALKRLRLGLSHYVILVGIFLTGFF